MTAGTLRKTPAMAATTRMNDMAGRLSRRDKMARTFLMMDWDGHRTPMLSFAVTF
jgi:hypothetical protein